MIIDLEIEKLTKNNTSGSISLLHSLQKIIRKAESANIEINGFKIIKTIEKYASYFDQFMVVKHFIEEFTEFVSVNENPKIKKAKNIHGFIKDYEKTWEKNLLKISELASNYIVKNNYKSVLIHSNSKSITNLLKFYAQNYGSSLQIYQTLSGPANEGIIQAEILSKLGFKVFLISDLAFGRFEHEIDFVVLGADIVYKNVFVNKIGSLVIAKHFKSMNKPVFVLCDSRKFCNKKITEFVESKKPAHEICLDTSENITPLNYYFEPVNLKYVNTIISDKEIGL